MEVGSVVVHGRLAVVWSGLPVGRRVVIRVAMLAGAGLAVLLAGLPVLTTPAWAHSRLLGTDPADGTTVTGPLPAVTLTFNEVVRADLSTVLVEGADHTGYGDGPARVVDHRMSQPVHPLRSGDYRVAWRAISADGHPIEGEFRFTVALPPGREPAPPAEPVRAAAPVATTGGSTPLWWWVAGAVTLGAVAAGLIRVRRRRPTGTTR